MLLSLVGEREACEITINKIPSYLRMREQCALRKAELQGYMTSG